MPIEENTSNNNTGSSQSSSTPNTSQAGSISDLGDILLDQTLDTVEKNDFKPVGTGDIDLLHQDTVTEEIGEEGDTNDPFPVTSTSSSININTPVSSEPLDLSSIVLDAPVVSSPFVENVVETKPIEEKIGIVVPVQNEIHDILENSPASIAQESVALSDITINLDQNQNATPDEIVAPIITPEVVHIEEASAPIEQKNGTESILGDLDSIGIGNSNFPDIKTEQTPTIQENPENIVPNESTKIDFDLSSVDMTIPEPETTLPQEVKATEESSLIGELPQIEVTPTPSTIEEPMTTIITPEVTIPIEEVKVEEIKPEIVVTTPEVQIPSTPPPVETIQPVIQTPTIPEQTNNVISSEEKVALETIANDISQGIDLDTLMPTAPEITPKEQPILQPATNTNSITTNSTKNAFAGFMSLLQGGQSSQKKILLGLGGFALLGLLFFGYQLLSGPDTTTVIPAPIERKSLITGNDTLPPDISNTGDSDIITGDEVVINTGTNEVSTTNGSISGDTTSENTGDTTVQPTTKTLDQVKAETQILLSKVRKTLIKATIAKNGPMRLSAFELQKDIEDSAETLEKTNDISTLDNSEKQLETFSQRLDSISNKLNGGSQ